MTNYYKFLKQLKDTNWELTDFYKLLIDYSEKIDNINKKLYELKNK